MPAHEQDQGAPEIDGEQRHQDGRYDAPHDQRMPFPLPDFPDEKPRVMAQVLNVSPAKRKAAGMEEVNTNLNEGDEQEEVEGRHGMSANLRGDLIEPEDPRQHDNENGSRAH